MAWKMYRPQSGGLPWWVEAASVTRTVCVELLLPPYMIDQEEEDQDDDDS